MRSYLAHYVQLCSESPEQYRHQPNLRMLDAISRTLEAVYRRMGISMQQVSQLASRRDVSLDDRDMASVTSSVPTSAIQTFPYNTRALHWNSDWTRNKEEKYCYCGTNKQEPALQCKVGCCFSRAMRVHLLLPSASLVYRSRGLRRTETVPP